jgi:hypothetical protein
MADVALDRPCAGESPWRPCFQAAHSARFMITDACTRGVVGAEFSKTMGV